MILPVSQAKKAKFKVWNHYFLMFSLGISFFCGETSQNLLFYNFNWFKKNGKASQPPCIDEIFLFFLLVLFLKNGIHRFHFKNFKFKEFILSWFFIENCPTVDLTKVAVNLTILQFACFQNYFILLLSFKTRENFRTLFPFFSPLIPEICATIFFKSSLWREWF
jgi:hypothetical protein